MKLPQFELWRLFASTALFAVAFGLLTIAWRARTHDGDLPELLVWPAVLCLGAGCGLPFRSGIFGALIGVSVVLLIIVAIAVYLLASWFFSGMPQPPL